MTKKTTGSKNYTGNRPTLYLAFELGVKEWKLGFYSGWGRKLGDERFRPGT